MSVRLSQNEAPQHTWTSLGSKKETHRESTLSYGHGNTTVQMISEEPARERCFPLGQLELKVAVMEQNEDKHEEQSAALTKVNPIKRKPRMFTTAFLK